MDTQSIDIAAGILVGIGATLVMDLWSIFLRRTFGIASLSFCLVGRWLGHMPAGQFTHDSITRAPKKPGECALGWLTHYLIGSAFALLMVIPNAGEWLEHPSLLPALLVGLATVLLPFLIMQPAFGLGIAATKTANPAQARIKSLMTHVMFGVGLYFSALILNQFPFISA